MQRHSGAYLEEDDGEEAGHGRGETGKENPVNDRERGSLPTPSLSASQHVDGGAPSRCRESARNSLKNLRQERQI